MPPALAHYFRRLCLVFTLNGFKQTSSVISGQIDVNRIWPNTWLLSSNEQTRKGIHVLFHDQPSLEHFVPQFDGQLWTSKYRIRQSISHSTLKNSFFIDVFTFIFETVFILQRCSILAGINLILLDGRRLISPYVSKHPKRLFYWG